MKDAGAAGGMDRRTFLKGTALAVTGLAAGCASPPHSGPSDGSADRVFLVVDPATSSQPSVAWASAQLKDGLRDRGIDLVTASDVQSTPPAARCVVLAGPNSAVARDLLQPHHLTPPATDESLAMLTAPLAGRSITLACGADARGVTHAVTDLSDRVGCAPDPHTALVIPEPIVEGPASRIRNVMKCFCSEPLDKPWWYDREQWTQYLDMLATNRFSRFSLTLGVGYNSALGVTDGYFVFPYSFFVGVPGYDVKATGLPDAERDRNLETLRFISDETARRGLQFQLGLWTHAYNWPQSPNATYVTTGVNASNHAPYCRDALAILLRECPAIKGVTLRVHGESGVPDRSQDFWRVVFEPFTAAQRAGRTIEIDMHAKELPQETLDVALATGQPVVISPKFSAEHMGLPYHQAAIRELEQSPREGPNRLVDRPGQLSAGSRKFTRYGYADLLAADRRYGVLHRVWPGTQRLLLWGDDRMARAFGHAASFCGSDGIEFFEPLSFRGRKGTGDASANRCGYTDPSLNPTYDWQKYLITYRLLGRLTYNPSDVSDFYSRFLLRELSQPGENLLLKPSGERPDWNHRDEVQSLEGSLRLQWAREREKLTYFMNALAHASRILPLITSAHLASADCTRFWPEVYTDMPIVDAGRSQPYNDTPAPKVFGNVSPLDPQLFAGVNEWVDAEIAGQPLAKYSPLDVAGWLIYLSEIAQSDINTAKTFGKPRNDAAFRRLREDIIIQCGIGRFFAYKLTAAMEWRRFERTHDERHLRRAVNFYRGAKDVWAGTASRAATVYIADLAFGSGPNRGCWSDRLAAIDADYADMKSRLDAGASSHATSPEPPEVMVDPIEPPGSGLLTIEPPGYDPTLRFTPGAPFIIHYGPGKANMPAKVRLRYRHVNQAAGWESLDMLRGEHEATAVIPASYAGKRYPIQYYFEVTEGERVRLDPRLGRHLSSTPYLLAHPAAKRSPE